ncbi:MAG: NAD(P)H-quinone oxidoreductase [Actinomycetota bacterium]|nr:NAD(P)H-quinone oxidoreductase [Actinomycetota bacterium]
MQAIIIDQPGGPEVMRWGRTDEPTAGPGEVVIQVAAAGVNRADLLQRRGFYPPPRGTSQTIGLECSGTIVEVGDGVGWHVGDEVCALLAGGGYAEKVVVPGVQVLPKPSTVDLVTAAGLPEVACTVWSNLVDSAGLSAGETLLVHGGAGGIGTHAIQVAKALGATVAVTAGTTERLNRCGELGADILLNYRTGEFEKEVEADVILDNMGAKYLTRNIAALKRGGRLVVIGMQGGTTASLDLGGLLKKNASVTATGLRYRPVAEKGAIVASVLDRVWPMLAYGSVKPVVSEVMPIERAGDAHRLMEEGGLFGKVVLTV